MQFSPASGGVAGFPCNPIDGATSQRLHLVFAPRYIQNPSWWLTKHTPDGHSETLPTPDGFGSPRDATNHTTKRRYVPAGRTGSTPRYHHSMLRLVRVLRLPLRILFCGDEMEVCDGVEPTTACLQNRCSAIELTDLKVAGLRRIELRTFG